MQELDELIPPPPSIRSGEPAQASEGLLKELAPRLNPHSRIPLYRQVSSQIGNWIENGLLQPGEQLASERKMTDLLRVSRRTVRAALGDLIERRYVSATHGRGNFALEPPNRRTLRFLALERFSPEHWGLTPHHYDLINEAEANSNTLVHYKYAPTLEKMMEILLNPPSGYQGLLMIRPMQEWIDELLGNDLLANGSALPLMVVGRDLSGSSLNFVSPNHWAQTYEATRKFIALGFKRIGYVSGGFSTAYIRMAWEGYSKAMEEADLPAHPEDLIVLEMTKSSANEEKLIAFLAARKFEAIVVAGSFFAPIFERAVQRSSIVIPSQLSVILVAEQYVLDGLTMRWSAHVYPDAAVTLRSLEALSELSRGQSSEPIQELVPHGVCEGATCRAPV